MLGNFKMLTKDNITKIKGNFDDILSDGDIDEKGNKKDGEKEILISKKILIGTNILEFAKVFIISFDYLGNNLYLVDDEKIVSEINKILYFGIDTSEIRELLEDHNIDNYISEERIKKIVDNNRNKMYEVISLFYKLFADE